MLFRSVAAVLTAFYMTRETFLVFLGNERFRAAGAHTDDHDGEAAHASADDHGTDGGHHEISTESPTIAYPAPPKEPWLTHDPHEGSPTMVIPVLVLAFLSVVGGLLVLPFRGVEVIAHFLEPAFEEAAPIDPSSFLAGAALSLLAIAIALTGIAVGVSMYRRGLADPADDPIDRRLGVLGRVFGNAYYVDSTIGRLVGGPITAFAAWVARVVDQGVIDGAVNGIAAGVVAVGGGLRRLQSGIVRQYALVAFAGVLALLIYVLVRSL